MKSSVNRLSLCITALTLFLWAPQALATGGNMGLVNSFCGPGTINNCSFCHTADPGTNQDTYNCGNNSADCSTNQLTFQQDRTNGGVYCTFCASDARCTTSASQCTSNADCDDGLFCNGAETCDGSGNCQPGTRPCTVGQACDETNHCMAGPECTTDADCDDGLFCNGTEICDGQNRCQSGTTPCAAGESCNETDGCIATTPAGSTEGETLYGDNCASCHGADGSGGTIDEDVRGESADEIAEAIGKVSEMQSLDFLDANELNAIAAFLGNGADGDNEMEHNGEMKHDEDGDGISDDDEGMLSTDGESEDADEDGTPDYMDPDVTHFASDNHDGSMVLMTDDGRLEASETIDEAATLPAEGKPTGVIFKWGFIGFNVTGITPGGSVNITLRMPENLPADAEYWKYDEQGYHKMEMVSINGNELTFTLTDDDYDGIIVDPGAVGVPVTNSDSSSGGGGGCSLQMSGNSASGLDPALFLILLLPLFLKGLTFRKNR